MSRQINQYLAWSILHVMKAIPLLAFLNDNEIVSTASTGSNCMCSNDITLLALIGDKADILTCPIASNIAEDDACIT